MTKYKRSYYMKPVKIIRDLVHGYVNLTRFDLKIIDTVPFQRLSDVRQLTCQHVYPAARHTRFEHSLGVQELMRNAVKYLNRNGIIGYPSKIGDVPILSESLEFNASVAALLHDIGHCPFSHMGETEFDKKEVLDELVSEIKDHASLSNCHELIERLQNGKLKGSVHEQLSCIIILRKYSEMLSVLTEEANTDEDACSIEIDFELIIRSILGIEYDISTVSNFDCNKEKNVIVRLLNSNIFDVDKLDYVMRDSFFTGVGTPKIDTKRLFRNMYLDRTYSIVFTSKAVPSLQNMIDARDGLYMYVYNHHAVVYSDFLNTYISRRLSRNSRAFYKMAYPSMNSEELDELQQTTPIFAMGLVPKSYLFSVNAIVEEHHSDSAWLSLLNIIHINYQDIMNAVKDLDSQSEIQKYIKQNLNLKLQGELDSLSTEPNIRDDKRQDHSHVEKFDPEIEDKLSTRIYNSMHLIHQSMTRFYLKPWWKTVFEYMNFMNHYFQDDRIRKKIGKYICDGGEYGLESDEFRSQIAKGVMYLTIEIDKHDSANRHGLLEPLNDGDFFVVQRSPRFFSPDTIDGIEIALKNNEILGPPTDVNRQEREYYIKSLTNIIPQKDYSSIYAKEGFYIYSKQINRTDVSQEDKSKHYKLLEQLFAFVVKELVDLGEPRFVELFQDRGDESTTDLQVRQKQREQFETELYDKFLGGSLQ